MQNYILTTDTELYGRSIQLFQTEREAEAELFKMIRVEAKKQELPLSEIPALNPNDWRDAWDYVFHDACDWAYIEPVDVPSTTRVWAIASDGRDGTQVEFLLSEKDMDDRIWEMITPDFEWGKDRAIVDPDEYRERFKGDWGAAMENYTPEYLTFEVDYIDVIPSDTMAALGHAAGAIGALQEQIDQMRGMFNEDEDETIQEAYQAGDDALAEINAIRNAGKEV